MKTVIITGTTSGLGRSLLNSLLSEDVSILAINRLPGTKLENSHSSAKLTMMTCDLSKLTLEDVAFPPSTFEGVSEVVFVMNAATIQPLKPAAAIPSADLQMAFNVNFFSYVTLTRILLEKCRDRNLPLRIIFISTGSINRTISGWSAYSASKGALLSFCKHVALENSNVKFEAFDPGIFKSNIQDQISVFNAGSSEIQIASDFTEISEISNRLRTIILLDSQ